MKLRLAILFVGVCFLVVTADAQTLKRSKIPLKPVAPKVTASPTPAEAEPPVVTKTEPKKNERPGVNESAPVAGPRGARIDPAYRYEFAQPEFEISRIVIEHDEQGRGSITFTKKMFDDTATDPLQVSPAVLERINGAYAALNFLDSNESYQFEKDFSHLGVSTFRLRRGGKERATTFSYTQNKNAKILADEYRRLSNQSIWVFDINVARENQPLEAPRLLDALESLIRRNEIADPQQLAPLLNSLTNDERVPLIARNHAKKLTEKIEKGKK